MFQETYQIVTNREELEKFINFLPDLKVEETYFLALFYRTKYINKPENVTLKDFKTNTVKKTSSSKDKLFQKIKQLECPIGTYTIGNSNSIVPQEALALYMYLNPRSYKKTYKDISHYITSMFFGDIPIVNPMHLSASKLQSNKSKSNFVMFDLDRKDNIEEVYKFVNKEGLFLIETKGGYHIGLIMDKIHKEFKNTCVKNILQIEGIDKTGDFCTPVPGTYQGGFTPKLITFN